MDSAKPRYSIRGRTGKATIFWFLVFIVSSTATAVLSGGITWFLVLMTALFVIGAVQLLRSRGEIGYVELDQDGLVVHLITDSYVAYSDLEGASHQGRRVQLQFNRALPVGPLPIYGFYRRSIQFKVDEAESLVGILNAQIGVQNEAHSN